MRTVKIDFTDSTVGTLGRAGEHKNTEVVFSLTPELAKCDLITAEIGTANGEKIPVEGKRDNENKTFTLLLTKQLTAEGVLALQLIGYVMQEGSDEPQIIAKSPVVSGVITPSINGLETQADSNPSLLERIWAKMKSLHTHNNLSILDKLTEKMIKLLTAGAMVETAVRTDEETGDTVLRLKLLRQDDTVEPAFINLPIFGVSEAYDEETDSFGMGLDIGLTHYRPMPQVSANSNGSAPTNIHPNMLYNFGEVDTLHIYFVEGNADYVQSYYFSFIANGSTMFTLPTEVKWGNDNEIVIEGGKRYEVSVVNNVALWTSATVPEAVTAV